MSSVTQEQKPQEQKLTSGIGTAALVVGIVAIAGSFLPLLNIASILIAVVGLALGIVGLIAKNKPRGRALAGTILSGLAIVISIIVLVAAGAAVAGLSKSISESTSAPQGSSAAPASDNQVTYEVTSDSDSAGNVTYMTFDDGGTGQEQAQDAPLPFSKVVPLAEGTPFSSSIFSLVAQASADATTISCKVSHNGKVISEHTSTGQYAVVTCSGTGE